MGMVNERKGGIKNDPRVEMEKLRGAQRKRLYVLKRDSGTQEATRNLQQPYLLRIL